MAQKHFRTIRQHFWEYAQISLLYCGMLLAFPALLLVNPEEDILLITDDGTIIRTPVEDIRLCGRNTQGVRVMKLQEGSKVIGVARADKEEEEAEEIPVQDASEEVQASEENASAEEN